jgi:phosphoglycolate phosphatase
MIGDSDVDIQTARNCGARSIGCSYGLAPQSLATAAPDALADSPLEWPAALRQVANAMTVR